MKRFKVVALSVLAAGIALVLGGCNPSQQARSMEIKESLLINPVILQKGTDDQALYRYVNTNADMKSYTKVIVDPVILSKSAEEDAASSENYQKLVNNAHVYLTRELGKDYQIVSSIGPDTMRVQIAIIAADHSKPVRSLLATVMPIGLGLSLVKYSATGKPSAVGEISVEFKITDATTGELLGAAIDRRVGGITLQGIWDTWNNADDALQYWAKKASFVLCEQRGGTACVKP